MENSDLQENWVKIIAYYRDSGLTAVEWCEKFDCPMGRLKYWVAKFDKAQRQPADETKWAQVEIVDANSPQVTTISIHVGAARIEVNPGFDLALLADVLKVARATC